MITRSRLVLSLFILLGAIGVRMTAQGPLTPIGQLRGRTDSSGYLMVNTAASGGGGASDATAANQVTGNASLSSIDTKTPALGQALAAASVPVVLTAAQISTLTPTAGIDPCALNAKVYLAISQATSTQLITGTSAKKIYICSFFVAGADAENMSVVAGTGSVCASSTVAVVGGTTAAAGPNMAANSGFSIGNGASAVAATTVNQDNLCLLQSGSGRVAGSMTYVVQ